MAWSKWSKNDNGSESKEKVVKDSTHTSTHYLNTTGGDKENHTHVIVRENNETGAKSAHAVPHKDNR